MLGFFLALLPEGLLRGLCLAISPVINIVRPSRKRKTLANLKAAFPERNAAWREKIYQEHSRRIIETGLLVLALPHFSENRLKRMLLVDAETASFIEKRFGAAQPARAAILAIPHLTLTEAMTAFPAVLAHSVHPTWVIFRPLPSPALDRWVKETRSRHGITLLSRKEGYTTARRALRQGQTVGVLFDQKAGRTGTLLSFFDRPASSSELPGLLAEKYQADVFAAAMERTGFWRAQLKIEQLDCAKDTDSVTLATNDWLEHYLRQSDDRTADWLWMHDRWGNYKKAHERLHLGSKRSLLTKQLEQRGQSQLARRTNVWIILPDCSKTIAAAEDLIRRIRAARPDFALTLCSAAKGLKRLADAQLAERLVYIDRSPSAARRQFGRLAEDLPETVFVFDESSLADRLARSLRCPQRIGLSRSKRDRPLLTDPIAVKGAESPKTPVAIVREWGEALQKCGLAK